MLSIRIGNEDLRFRLLIWFMIVVIGKTWKLVDWELRSGVDTGHRITMLVHDIV